MISQYKLPSICCARGLVWRRRTMMTSSNGNIFRVTGHLCGEFTGARWIPTQRPVTQSFDVFFDLRLNKRLSKKCRGWWFETLSRPLWRHRNATSYCGALYKFRWQEENKLRWLFAIKIILSCSPCDIRPSWITIKIMVHESHCILNQAKRDYLLWSLFSDRCFFKIYC